MYDFMVVITDNLNNIEMDKYQVIETIGKGSFGLVSLIKKKSDGTILVWKEMDYGSMSQNQKHQLVSEVNILSKLNHQNIVRYHDRIVDHKQAKVYIIMEYCSGGDLGTLLKKHRKAKSYNSEDLVWKVFAQIVLALSECHNRKILHRDLKPANIFIDSNNNIKLGDFGLSKMMGEHTKFAQTHVGTPYYMSPEQIEQTPYNQKSDIWSAGCLLYQIASLRPPFEAQNHLALATKIKKGKFERIPFKYSEDLQELIESMLNLDPKNRPSVDDLMNIPLIKIRIEQKQLKQRHIMIKAREEKLRQRQAELKLREIEYEERSNGIMRMNSTKRKVEWRSSTLDPTVADTLKLK